MPLLSVWRGPLESIAAILVEWNFMVAVDLKRELLEWAISRSGRSEEELEKALKHLPDWRSGEKKPTFKQLEKLAQVTRTPIGFFFLPEPPQENVPIPDLRTFADRGVRQPSADLLETIYQCQQRQSWYEEYARSNAHPILSFVGCVSAQDNAVVVAEQMRVHLGFQLSDRAQMRTWEEALRQLINLVEDSGVMVMVSGVVACNTSRKLNPAEFRGFALSNPLAPLIFVNGSDSKAAQMFTLIHELAHIWLGQSALTDVGAGAVAGPAVEQWCNQVAAEFLIPLAQMPRRVEQGELFVVVRELSRRFKVSSLVVLRRLHDAGALSQSQFWGAFNAERERLDKLAEEREPGGQFYPTHALRVGRVLGRALASEALEGRTSFTEAFRLMAVKKLESFEELARRFGVEVLRHPVVVRGAGLVGGI